jgi:hypothetical protein
MGYSADAITCFGICIGGEAAAPWWCEEFEHDFKEWYEKEVGIVPPAECIEFGHYNVPHFLLAVPGTITKYYGWQPREYTGMPVIDPENLRRFAEWKISSQWWDLQPKWYIGAYYG